jgi:hypothetical protein
VAAHHAVAVPGARLEVSGGGLAAEPASQPLSKRILGADGGRLALARLGGGFVAQRMQGLTLADQARRLVSDGPSADLDGIRRKGSSMRIADRDPLMFTQ